MQEVLDFWSWEISENCNLSTNFCSTTNQAHSPHYDAHPTEVSVKSTFCPIQISLKCWNNLWIQMTRKWSLKQFLEEKCQTFAAMFLFDIVVNSVLFFVYFCVRVISFNGKNQKKYWMTSPLSLETRVVSHSPVILSHSHRVNYTCIRYFYPVVNAAWNMESTLENLVFGGSWWNQLTLSHLNIKWGTF